MGSVIEAGTPVRFLRGDGRVMGDVVLGTFWQDNVLPPAQPGVAFRLTLHSWCWASEIVAVGQEDRPRHRWATEHVDGHMRFCVSPGGHSTSTYCAASAAEPRTLQGEASLAWLIDHPGQRGD